MQYSVVNFVKTFSHPTFRLDSEYYLPKYLEIEKIIEDKKYLFAKLDDLNLKIDASAFYPSLEPYYGSGTMPFIRVVDTNARIDYDACVKISPDIFNQYKTLKKGKRGDIIITKGGSIARIGLLERDSALSRDLIFVNTSKLPEKDYVFMFYYFLTDIYNSLLIRSSSMTAQPHLTLTLVRDIPIYIPSKTFKDAVYSLHSQNISYYQKSKLLYKEAQTLLLSELGLLDWKPKHQLTFVKNFSDTQKAGRIDAEYFQPKYDEIVDKINAFETIELGDKRYFDIVTGTYINEYTPEGEYYIRSVDINNDLTIETDNMYKTKEKLASKFRVKDGDIVTSRVGSIGTLGFVSEELDGSFISDNILRIRNKYKDLDSLFLAFYLKIVGSILMERLSRGSVQQRLNQETLKEIEIPILEHKTQKKITEKVFASHQLKKQSKHLLECAKRAVEMAIEEDEETAMEWLKKEVAF